MSRKLPLGIVGLDHVDLTVRDLASARPFFEKVLGLEVLGMGRDHCFFLLGDQVIGLRADPRGPGPKGVHHLALRVQRWTGLRQRLKGRGVPILEERTRDESRSYYVQGPEGILVELVHRPDPHRHPVH
jgi:catechol 2,3-dioxygenase-like lactoylglutathione lyase family enzyme